jgi:acetyltransferase-like isoleucine patch superfamily enzyme
MKAYILPSGVEIHPFGDPVGDAMIGNRRLRDAQERVLRRAGLDVERISGPEDIRESDFLLTYDDVFFTRRVIDDFVRRGRQATESLRCGLPADSLLVKRTRSLQDLDTGEEGGQKLSLYRLYLIHGLQPPGAEDGLAESLSRARPVRARFKEKIFAMPAPPHISGFASYEHPLTSSVVMHIRHWVHVLWANQLSVQIEWVENVLDHKLWSMSKALSSGLSALLHGRLSKAGYLWTLMGRANRKGKNCFIHPTATVEGCLLGDNVKIGAYALVRGCLLGDDVTIEDRANVYFSVVGSKCFISKNSTMVFCAGYPDSDLCVNGIQACLFGSRCAMTSRVWVVDLRAAGQTRVMHQGRLQPVDNKLLGACFGHACFAGLDVTIGQGREIPNGAVLIRPPGDILRRIPEDLPPGVPAWSRDGTAVTAEKKES